MTFLRNSNLKENGKFLYTIKITMFTFLIGAYILYNNLYNTSDYLKREYYGGINSDIQFHRSLAKHIPKKKLYNTTLKENLSDVKGSQKIKYLADELSAYPQSQKSVLKNLEDDITTYSKLKKRGLNNLDLYKKNYKHRYAKKNFFTKIDCYCEKKIFDKFDHINGLAVKYQNNKKRFKKIIFKKYGIGLILFTLIPLFGIIIPIYLHETYIKKKLAPITEGFSEGYEISNKKNIHFNGFKVTDAIRLDTCMFMKTLNSALMSVSIIIVLIVFIYILIKVLKYERLKLGKDKMCAKEYYYFCKDIF
ncbi:hypothetical protein PVNG_05840 [Plasmodium vivax North Korean]|uniref:Fam-l protein n=1 Tax=Plasmodium vivax North Korean TaxID=1035514 RepID=A0A0J9TP13_PLAVI|nr:hypothetical protein PVNG_05840 [Plasmodium vivax North Korean]